MHRDILFHPLNSSTIRNSRAAILPSLSRTSSVWLTLGDGFATSESPSRNPGISSYNTTYVAPELLIDHKCSVKSDIWRSACSIFEIRTGGNLFRTGD
ncbi:uncharacterized protein BDV17DRAFT_21577 [Aspergillus undulatus]|uniref:uncharacterized protein n=1 Tax=Aspergillus undulatus TaxID=1810928 RepID=UPI003CCD36A2